MYNVAKVKDNIRSTVIIYEILAFKKWRRRSINKILDP